MVATSFTRVVGGLGGREDGGGGVVSARAGSASGGSGDTGAGDGATGAGATGPGPRGAGGSGPPGTRGPSGAWPRGTSGVSKAGTGGVRAGVGSGDFDRNSARTIRSVSRSNSEQPAGSSAASASAVMSRRTGASITRVSRPGRGEGSPRLYRPGRTTQAGIRGRAAATDSGSSCRTLYFFPLAASYTAWPILAMVTCPALSITHRLSSFSFVSTHTATGMVFFAASAGSGM